jgi:hypothetical protein
MNGAQFLLLILIEAGVYEVVGHVKCQRQQNLPSIAKRAVKGARRAFISTLDSSWAILKIERGTKRNEVHWS